MRIHKWIVAVSPFGHARKQWSLTGTRSSRAFRGGIPNCKMKIANCKCEGYVSVQDIKKAPVALQLALANQFNSRVC
jgi:hypothetical protein